MATTVGLNFRLTAAVENFEKSMGEVNKKLGQIDRSSKQTATGMKLLAGIEVGRILLGGLKSIFGLMKSGVSTVFSLSRELSAAADAIGKLSASTGVAVEPLQVFQRVAEYNGISGDKLGEALKRMTKRLAEAQQGFGEALPALQRLGLNVDELAKMKPEQAFLKIGAAIGTLPTKGAQAAAAFKIFSDQGLAMVPMFEDMENKIKATSKEMVALALVISDEQVKAIETMNDRFGDVLKSAKMIATQVLANFAPAITEANEKLLEFIKNFQFKGQQGGQAFVQFVTEAFAKGALKLLDWSEAFLKFLRDAGAIFLKAAEYILSAADTLSGFIPDKGAPVGGGGGGGGWGDDEAPTSTLGRLAAAAAEASDALGSTSIDFGGLRESLQRAEASTNRAGTALLDLDNTADMVPSRFRLLMQSVEKATSGSSVLADVFSTGSRGVASAMDILRDGPRSAVQAVVGSMSGLLNSVGLTRDKLAQLAQTTKFLNDVEKTELDRRMSQWDQWAAQQKDILKGLGGNTFEIETHFADMRKVYEQNEKQRLASERAEFNAELDRRATIQKRFDDRMERIRTGNYKKSTDKFDTGFKAVFKTVGDFWDGLTGGDGVIDFPELEKTLPELRNQTTEIQNVAKAVTNMAANFVLASF